MELYQILILAGIVCGVIGLYLKWKGSKKDPLGLFEDE
jgi:hypothetical protein